VADRMKTRAAEANRARPDAAAPQARPAPSPAPAPNGTASGPAKTVPDKTAAGKTTPGKTTPGKTAPDKATPTHEPPAAAEEAPAEPVPAEPPVPAELPAPAAAEPAAVAASVLPVPNYDGLTVASLRARLRNLDPPQLRTLIDYEKAHAGRADVLAMFERRITKLESGEA
jgi:hypothetical protein